jgi:hypothetical protein
MIADIFYTNCVNAGVLPMVLDQSLVDELLADAMVPQTALMTIDLKTQEIVRAGGQTVRFDVPSFGRERLLQGADEIDMTLQDAAAIESFVAKRSRAAFALMETRVRDATWNLRWKGEREWRAALFRTDHEIVDLAAALAAYAEGGAHSRGLQSDRHSVLDHAADRRWPPAS